VTVKLLGPKAFAAAVAPNVYVIVLLGSPPLPIAVTTSLVVPSLMSTVPELVPFVLARATDREALAGMTGDNPAVIRAGAPLLWVMLYVEALFVTEVRASDPGSALTIAIETAPEVDILQMEATERLSVWVALACAEALSAKTATMANTATARRSFFMGPSICASVDSEFVYKLAVFCVYRLLNHRAKMPYCVIYSKITCHRTVVRARITGNDQKLWKTLQTQLRGPATTVGLARELSES
jgi:hypothetical protein